MHTAHRLIDSSPCPLLIALRNLAEDLPDSVTLNRTRAGETGDDLLLHWLFLISISFSAYFPDLAAASFRYAARPSSYRLLPSLSMITTSGMSST